MAMVSVDVDLLQETIDALKMARATADGSANYIRPILYEAGVHVPELSDWTGGEGIEWLTRTIAFLERRLEFAKLLLETSGSSDRVVSFDESVLARLDHADVRADVAAAVAALSKGDAKALEEILKRYRVEVEGQAQPFYDPEFTRLFAVNARPIWLADLLLRLDRDPDVDLEWYAGFLDSLAGVLSTGAHEMTEAQLAVFTENWAAINNEVVTGPRIPTKADLPVTSYAPRVQALSLLVGRGDWPESFLTGVKEGVEAQEGDLGAAYWLSQDVSVRDPAVVDSATGEAMTVTDPMYGIYRAGAVNPEWFIENYGDQITTVEYIMGGRNDPTDMYDTGFAGVATGLNHAFHRGFDPASYTALLTAITAADAWTLINGGQPTFLPQAQIIAKSLLLEEHRNMEFPEWIHMALDGLAMMPVVDILADGLNTILYFFRGDYGNAGISMASVFIPAGLDAFLKTGRWADTFQKVGNGIGFAPDGSINVITKAEADEFISGLLTRDPNYGSAQARNYQRTYAGSVEYEIPIPGDSIWVDGLRHDSNFGLVAVEAKHVDVPGGSLYEGTDGAPPEIRDGMWVKFDDEIRRYGAAINDPNNPVSFLEVTTSTLEARIMIADRIARLQHASGVYFPFTVILQH